VVSESKPATQEISKNNPPRVLSNTINQQIVFVCASAAICISGMQLSLYLLNDNFKSFSESVLSNNPMDREELANGMMADRFRFRCRKHLLLAPLVSFLALMLLGLYLQEQSNSNKRKLAKALLELKNNCVKVDSASVATYQESRSKDCQGSDNADQALAEAFNSLATSLKDLDSGHRQWVADTSHELRTPIAVLRAQVEAFQDGVHEITPRNLEVLHSEIMALSKLVDDLHWLAKYDVGQIRSQASALDINQTLQDVLESFEERREAKEIALDNQVPTEEKLIIDGDSSRIRQVITNLVENSLRYTNKGGTLRISHNRSGKRLKLSLKTQSQVSPMNCCQNCLIASSE
jgi:signal transduction histidine kinase